jgi:hypothetical protein
LNETQEHLRDVVELVSANTRLSEVLASSQREVIAKVGSLSADDTMRLRETCHKQRVMNWVLLAVIVVGGWFSHRELTWAVDNGNRAVTEALAADSRARQAQLELDKFRDDQAEFNETVLQAFEEIKKKWTQSPTKPKH